MTGWGQVFQSFFNDQVKVFNHAAGGRSSKSFIREGRWQKALADKPDFVFIQFGHNDCPGKGDRTTDPATDYRDFLRQYIRESRAAGATPVLVTPVARRTFQDDVLTDILAPYAQAMQIVGKENDVAVIPLHQMSSDLYRKLGDAGSAHLTASPEDRTHFSRKGALTMVRLVIGEIPSLLPELSPFLKPMESPTEANRE
jgi:lysophospholipase L1-like esterase